MSGDEISSVENLDKRYRYKWTDPFSKQVAQYEAVSICDDALEWCHEILASNPTITYGEVMEIFLGDPSAPAGWAVANIIVFGQYLDKSLLEGYVKKVVNEYEPVSTYHLYLEYYDLFSPDLRNMLRNAFVGIVDV